MDMTEDMHSLRLGREEGAETAVGYDVGSSTPKDGNTSLATSD